MIRLLQLQHSSGRRRVAVVDEPRLRLLRGYGSVYEMAMAAIQDEVPLSALALAHIEEETMAYDAIYEGKQEAEWTILPALDFPGEESRVVVSGTGLTHLGSAQSRHSMHGAAAAAAEPETDSMKMFRWGVEGGKPGAGKVGVAPEWFYKGTGAILRAHNEPLEVPAFGEDGGEEAEIVGLYIIDKAGTPVRVGMAQGNEFSDHVFEKKNYLNLAGSKLRTCSIGPEIVIDPDFSQVPGHGRVMRKNAAGTEEILWSKPLATGEAEMSHSLANMEHHHFKFAGHRRPGDVHVHFFGTCALSFSDGIRLQDGDVMQVHFKGFGRPLRNSVKMAEAQDNLVRVRPLK